MAEQSLLADAIVIYRMRTKENIRGEPIRGIVLDIQST